MFVYILLVNQLTLKKLIVCPYLRIIHMQIVDCLFILSMAPTLYGHGCGGVILNEISMIRSFHAMS